MLIHPCAHIVVRKQRDHAPALASVSRHGGLSISRAVTSLPGTEHGWEVVMAQASQRLSKRWRIAAVLCSALLLLAWTAPAANGAIQGGRAIWDNGCCQGATLDGISAHIAPTFLGPAPNYCIVISVGGQGPTSGNQLEVGLGKCSAFTSIDNTCSTHEEIQRFDERETGGLYTCYPHGTQSINQSIGYVARYTSGPGTWSAIIDGNQYESLAGFGHDDNYAFQWGEATGNSTCNGTNWGAVGNFTGVRDYNRTTGWHDLYTDNLHEDPPGCWQISPYQNFSFVVSH